MGWCSAVAIRFMPRWWSTSSRVRPAALPTPAAGVRVVSYRATPALPVKFLSDGADNLFAIAPRSGRYRLVYLLEAEPRYFAGPLWEWGPWRPRLRDVPATLIRPLPRRLQGEAHRVLRQLGVRYGRRRRLWPGARYGLVGYFRAFTLAELDEDVGPRPVAPTSS